MRNSLVLGKCLGEGVARRVYEWLPDDTLVAKLQMRESYQDRDYQNIAEWQLWTNASAELKKWLAPCKWISPCGTLLLQHWCSQPVRLPIPGKVPPILADCHDDNFGELWDEEARKTRVVLVDYGRNWAIEMASNAKAMKKMVPVDHDGSQVGT